MTRVADRAFTALIGIALLSSVILVALFLSLLSHLGEPVPALVLALASIGIVLGLASLARQLADTLALIRRLLRARVAMSSVEENWKRSAAALQMRAMAHHQSLPISRHSADE